ncbi:MAG: hypothetical protein H6658_13995 [Ardenticatenaceae bacterium]|nr:hypothetical protein [Ardenticatenaceae bacterium]
MDEWLVPLAEVRQEDAALVGGKAAALGELLAAGFPVPPGVCVTTAVFHAAIAPYQSEIERLCQLIEAQVVATAVTASENILTLLQDVPLPELEIGDWRLFATNLQSPVSNRQSPLAVRSSATAEDRGDASFAGQYATLLGVRGKTAVAEAIRTCWLSFFSPHALFDRAQHGALSGDEGMAVLIQPMIEAECAGVCLTVDPIQARDEVMVINAAWGLGVGVVEGSVATDSYWVQRRNLGLEKQRIVEKGERVGWVRGERREGRGVTSLFPLANADKRRAACLPEGWVRRVAAFGLAVEQVYGRPQDVEWAVADGRFWLLQSRPLTGLPVGMGAAPPFPVTWQDEAERRYFWQLTEHCAGAEPPLPLAHDFMALRESIREETCRYLGADRHEVWRMWNGRTYWRRASLGLTAADMALRQQVFADLQERLQTVGWTSWDYWGPEMVRQAVQLRSWAGETADGPALADHLARAQAVARYGLAIHPRIVFRPGQAFFEAFTAVSGLTGVAAQTAAYQLLDGEESQLTRLIDGLYELAQVAQGPTAASTSSGRAVAQLLLEMPEDVMARLAALPAAAAFRAKLADLLAEYGERMGHGYGSEMTIMTPTWQEEPERVLALVRSYLGAAEAPAVVRARRRRARDEQVAELCAACGDETAVTQFQHQLAYARQMVVGLEDHNHWIEQVAQGQLRLAVMAAARWLVAQGFLPDMADVFWLEFAEIEAALRGEVPLQQVIATRKAAWRRWAQMVPPPILGLPEAGLPLRPPLVDEVNVGEAGEENGRLVGLGASAGVAVGRACVVGLGEPLPELAPGTILVAQNAGPLWTPYFPQLAGLVLEEGSLGQHAAATAREYGIPAVISCRRATRLIVDGEWVRVDGKRGVVKLGNDVEDDAALRGKEN